MEGPNALKEVQPASTSSSGQIVPLQICRSYAKHGICALPGTCIYDHPPLAGGSAPSTPSPTPSTASNESNLAPTHAWEAAGQYFEPNNNVSTQEPCQTWIQTGSCPYSACQFSHPPISVQYPPKYSSPNNQFSLPPRSQHAHEQSRVPHSTQLPQQLPPSNQLSQLPQLSQQVPQSLAQQSHQPLNSDHPPRPADTQRIPPQYQIQRKPLIPPNHDSIHTLDQVSSASSVANKSAPKKLLCKNWNKGCKFGDSCRFYHPKPETTFDHLFKQSPPPRAEDDYFDGSYHDNYRDYDYAYSSKSSDIGHNTHDRLSSQQYQMHTTQNSQRQLQLPQVNLSNQLQMPQMPMQHMVQQLPVQLQMQPQPQPPYQQFQQVPILQSPQFQYQTPYLQAPSSQPMIQLQPQMISMQPSQQTDLYNPQPVQTHVYQSHMHEIHVSHQPQEQLHQLQQQLLQQQIQQQQMQQQLQLQQQQLQQHLQQKQQQLLQEQFQLLQLTDLTQDQSTVSLALQQPMLLAFSTNQQPEQSLPSNSQPQQEPEQSQPETQSASSKSNKSQEQRPANQRKYKQKNKKANRQQPAESSQSDGPQSDKNDVILERKHDTASPHQPAPTTEKTSEMNGNGHTANGKKKKKKNYKQQAQQELSQASEVEHQAAPAAAEATNGNPTTNHKKPYQPRKARFQKSKAQTGDLQSEASSSLSPSESSDPSHSASPPTTAPTSTPPSSASTSTSTTTSTPSPTQPNTKANYKKFKKPFPPNPNYKPYSNQYNRSTKTYVPVQREQEAPAQKAGDDN